jgi:hypothetical protein
MRWFRRAAKVPDSLANSGPRRIDPEQLAEARAIVRRALDAEKADGESAGRDLYRLGTA